MGGGVLFLELPVSIFMAICSAFSFILETARNTSPESAFLDISSTFFKCMVFNGCSIFLTLDSITLYSTVHHFVVNLVVRHDLLSSLKLILHLNINSNSYKTSNKLHF